MGNQKKTPAAEKVSVKNRENPEALQAFVGPGIPASRLTGDQDGLYVSHGPIISKAFGWTKIGTQRLCKTGNYIV